MKGNKRMDTVFVILSNKHQLWFKTFNSQQWKYSAVHVESVIVGPDNPRVLFCFILCVLYNMLKLPHFYI